MSSSKPPQCDGGTEKFWYFVQKTIHYWIVRLMDNRPKDLSLQILPTLQVYTKIHFAGVAWKIWNNHVRAKTCDKNTHYPCKKVWTNNCTCVLQQSMTLVFSAFSVFSKDFSRLQEATSFELCSLGSKRSITYSTLYHSDLIEYSPFQYKTNKKSALYIF